MRSVALYEMLFGLLTIAGGIVGFAVAGSAISLAAGIVAGLLLLGAGLTMQKGSRRGMAVALVVTVALLGYFGYALLATGAAFMPAGLMTILSAVSLVLLGIVLVQPTERKRIF